MNRLSLVLAACLLPGCVFYADDDCEFGGGTREGEGAYDPGSSLRNPDDGICYGFGGGGGGGGGGGSCGGVDEPAPVEPQGEADEGASADQASPPDWGYCQSQCTGLGEADCLATSACRAAYVGECPQDASCLPGDGNLTYFECWAVAPSGPVQGECAGLDAYECSRHDDCAAVHGFPGGTGTGTGDGTDPGGEGGTGEAEAPADIANGIGAFSHCSIEPGAAEVERCYGGWGTVVCDAAPPDCAEGEVPLHDATCWTGECVAREMCPEGTCEPQGDGPCDAFVPDCPVDYVPGVGDDGCYTGYCIPFGECAAQPAACDELGESGCIGRADCAPLYEGEDCTCVGDVCDCEIWNFVTCEAAA